MSNIQKTPLARTLPAFTKNKALDEIQKRGMALPGTVVSVSGAIVTVNFEVTGATLNNVTMPLFGPEYIRYPIKPGDKGVAFPASVYIGQVSGLGAPQEVADLNTLYGNLSTLVWFPIGNKNWTEPADTNAVTIYGPDGVTLRDTTNAASIVLKPTGITMNCAGHEIIINSSGVTIDGKIFLTHEHTPGTYIAGSTAVMGDSGAVA